VGLRSFVIKRIAFAVVLLIMAMSFNFYLFMVMPGDPTELFIPPRGITREQRDAMIASFRHVWGLDQPLYLQYLVYLKRMFSWDFGTSLVNQNSVSAEIMLRLPWTLLLMGGSAIIAIVVGVVLGVYIAQKRGTKLDVGMLSLSLITNSLPVFWLAMVFVLIFTKNLGVFPPSKAYPDNWGVSVPFPQPVISGFNSTSSGMNVVFNINSADIGTFLWGYFSHAFLPLLTLSVFQFGGFVLLTRATMLESLTEDYIVTARAKGVPERSVLFKHALKNASLPIITSVALTFGFVLSGAIITETVYSWPGLGQWIYRSVSASDYFSMQAIFFIITLCVIIANIVADLLYGVVDPRIKYG
jgi:ABC-type dipeptide/oligopeptide/nickel transport system permease component